MMNGTQDWRPLALALHQDAATREFVDCLTKQLAHSELSRFGPSVLNRLRPSVYFGSATFPSVARPTHAWHNSYIIAWIFAMDNVLDGCPSFNYAEDLQKLLRRRIVQPVDEELRYDDLQFANDPCRPVPQLGYSLYTLVETLQPLRQRLRQDAADAEGPRMFDAYLLEQIVPAMLQETRWRLGLVARPNYEEYIRVGFISICGGLCVSTVNAVLPDARWNWQAVDFATQQMRYATRLINDDATWMKEADEGKPNANSVLADELGSKQAAHQRVRELIDRYARSVHRLCWPYLQSAGKDDPLYVLYHYIYYCWVITEAMYSNGDFTTKLKLSEERLWKIGLMYRRCASSRLGNWWRHH